MASKENFLTKMNLDDLGKLELIIVSNHNSEEYRIWAKMMKSYHPLGYNRLFGKRLYYLIKSSGYGYIGGLSFNASARRLEARDKWIGWDDIDRQNNLYKIINNSRFLIMPQYKIPNLGSHIFSKCFNRLSDDWFSKYGFRPLLVESFVDTSKYDGALYKASNWKLIGKTKGRGRNDRYSKKKLSIKDIYVYPLDKRCKEKLSPTTRERKIEFKPSNWVEAEFEHLNLKDLRLNKRLIKIMLDFYSKPDRSIPEIHGGNWGQIKGTYRFFDNENVEMTKILFPHYQKTIERISQNKLVLVAQDTTTLNYSTLNKTKGLGIIDSNKKSKGFLMHDTLSFTASGVPLGLLDLQIWARKEEEFGKRIYRAKKPIEEKESYKWIKSFKATEKAKELCPNTEIINICDREADIYELFEVALKSKVKLLVRASHNRKLYKENSKLWEKLTKSVLGERLDLVIPANKQRKQRIAKMLLSYSEITIKPPKSGHKPIIVNAVYAQEINPPEGVEKVEWMLLTTLEVNSYKEARKVVSYYTKRWGIEVYHRILKTSCKIEKKGLGTDKRLFAYIAMELIIGYKIYSLTKLGQEHPNISAKAILNENELKILNILLKKKQMKH